MIQLHFKSNPEMLIKVSHIGVEWSTWKVVWFPFTEREVTMLNKFFTILNNILRNNYNISKVKVVLLVKLLD